MRTLFLAALLLAGAAPARRAQPGCRQFREGTFRVRFRHPQHGASFLLTRQGNLQTELNEQTGGVSRLAVTWLGDCTCQLRLLATTERLPREIEEYRRSAPLTTTILSRTSRYYTFRSQRKSSDPVRTDTAWVVRQMDSPGPGRRAW